MRITLVADPRDAWIGVRYDDDDDCLYVMPVPFFGLCFHFLDWRPS